MIKPFVRVAPMFVLVGCGGPAAPPSPTAIPGRFTGVIEATMDGGRGPMKIRCSVTPGHMRCDMGLGDAGHDARTMTWIVDVAKKRYCATLPSGERVVQEAADLEKTHAGEMKLAFVRTGKTPTIAGRSCTELEAKGEDGDVRACVATSLSPTSKEATLPLTGAMMPLLRELDVEGIAMGLEVKTKEGVGLRVDVQRVLEQHVDPKVFDGC